MNKNIFTPFKGIQNILFGYKREVIRNLINQVFIEIKSSEFSENSSDYYEELGFFVEYDVGGTCNALEFTELGNLFYDLENLFVIRYSTLRDKYDKISLNYEEEEGLGITYYDLGFSLTKKESKDNIETVLIFSKDYWD